eukprot:5992841-Amphidinium_carterae.1
MPQNKKCLLRRYCRVAEVKVGKCWKSATYYKFNGKCASGNAAEISTAVQSCETPKPLFPKIPK